MVKKKEDLKVAAKEYVQTLTELVDEIRAAQLRAMSAASKELVRLYWFIGKTVSKRQEESSWGDKFINNLARDIQNSFPQIKGFSRRNIFRMRAFYRAYANCATAVTQIEDIPVFSIPWGHNIVLVESVKDPEARLWYAQKTLQDGWSRSTLEEHIKKSSCERAGKAVTNFTLTLP
ncbi:hypothetical protein KAT92_03400 [Candidatus Babeliales bacterium]|nr:hypothetical protein [Candidatus Babeliales bacterium]